MIKKFKQYQLVIIALVMLFPWLASAHAGHSGSEAGGESGMAQLSVEELVADILQEQGVDKIEEIDCSKVEENKLERLGDALMERMHPGESHQIADQMMGGEGSASLRSMHILMAQRYLGCEEPGYVGTIGMMGDYDGMMSEGRAYGENAIRKVYWPFTGMMGIGMGIFWLFIVGLVGLLVKALFFNSGTAKARALLAERYARGELSREEYEKMKAQL